MSKEVWDEVEDMSDVLISMQQQQQEQSGEEDEEG